METLDVFVCLALTYTIHGTERSLRATARRLRQIVKPQSEASMILDTVLRSSVPSILITAALEQMTDEDLPVPPVARRHRQVATLPRRYA